METGDQLNILTAPLDVFLDKVAARITVIFLQYPGSLIACRSEGLMQGDPTFLSLLSLVMFREELLQLRSVDDEFRCTETSATASDSWRKTRLIMFKILSNFNSYF